MFESDEDMEELSGLDMDKWQTELNMLEEVVGMDESGEPVREPHSFFPELLEHQNSQQKR